MDKPRTLPVPGACVGNAQVFDLANRRWRPGDPNRIDVFGNCDACIPGMVSPFCEPAPPGNRLVIQVDLRAYPNPIQRVRLIGSFWGWNPNDGPIGVDPDGDGLYTVTFNDIPGVEFSYKWRINEQTEDLTGAGECVGNAQVFDLANRSWRPGQPSRIDVFGSCAACQ